MALCVNRISFDCLTSTQTVSHAGAKKSCTLVSFLGGCCHYCTALADEYPIATTMNTAGCVAQRELCTRYNGRLQFCVLSLCHTMLSMLRFCRAIKHRSVWRVNGVRRPGAESTSSNLEQVLFLLAWPNVAQLRTRSISADGKLARPNVAQLRTGSIFCGWKARLANQRRGKRGRLTPRRSNKTGGLFDSNVFFRLPLLRKVQTKFEGSKEKQVILALEVRSERRLMT